MSTQVSAVTGVAATPLFDAEQARGDAAHRWAGTPLATEHWLEQASGFPRGDVSVDPAVAATVVAVSRGYRLTRGHLEETVAFGEFLAGETFTAEERAELEQDVVDAFEDSPKRALHSLRPLSGGVRRVAALDPVQRAQRRLQALTTSYLLELRRQADGQELSPLMAVVSRHNPVVRHWASAGVVLVADALAARMEQHRLVLCLVGRELEEPAVLADQLLARAEQAGRLEVAELAGSELRLLLIRAWLTDLGSRALAKVREDVARAVTSALDVDIVVQHVGYRAALEVVGQAA
ncbi:hypothetical protein KIF24_11505 [Micromonospora sp. Llam7]|uniref:hypothetical protein n=1 Tax=Micromonospora tarapacensis TaxID=2835305 RepID=UPI001C835D16|nr:hypothetical protein [Micromonospora tarapacensis]MBX7266604.1 hypothetical protein [Micromonospora tarapacensis]